MLFLDGSGKRLDWVVGDHPFQIVFEVETHCPPGTLAVCVNARPLLYDVLWTPVCVKPQVNRGAAEMKNLSRVVWSEGMYVGPHHFQVQNRYYEDTVQFSTSSIWYQPVGFTGFELDAESLRNRTLALLHARGIFPDGLHFHMPEFDELPAPRALEELIPPTRENVEVLLAVPEHRPDGLNCATQVRSDNDSSVRYVGGREVAG